MSDVHLVNELTHCPEEYMVMEPHLRAELLGVVQMCWARGRADSLLGSHVGTSVARFASSHLRAPDTVFFSGLWEERRNFPFVFCLSQSSQCSFLIASVFRRLSGTLLKLGLCCTAKSLSACGERVWFSWETIKRVVPTLHLSFNF